MLDKNKGYKPTTSQDIVYGDETAKRLIQNIVTGKMPFPFAGRNGIILYGPNGTGKSALAQILPIEIDAIQPKFAEEVIPNLYKITAATDGRWLLDQIGYQLQFTSLSRYHYFILDEFDLLNPRHIESFKSVMNNEFSVFIMTTNNISKIDDGIKSRSHLIHMPLAAGELWLPTVKWVLQDQLVTAPDDQKLLDIVASCKFNARAIMGSTLLLATERRENGHEMPNQHQASLLHAA